MRTNFEKFTPKAPRNEQPETKGRKLNKTKRGISHKREWSESL